MSKDSSSTKQFSYLNPLNAAYINELEEQYQEDPKNLEETWRYFFDGFSLNGLQNQATSREAHLKDFEFEDKVMELIQAYRDLGYLIADVDPLDRGKKNHPLLSLDHFGLSEEDKDRVCQAGRVLGLGSVPLRNILKVLTTYYCSPVAVEYAHIEDPKARTWIQERVESNSLNLPLDEGKKLRLLDKLCEAEVFETFLQKRFMGQKRFSVEGCDTIIPILDFLIEESSEQGTNEVIIGMAHRGRLNVLANIFQKDLAQMLAEFSGNLDANVGDGDVKYHMGFSHNVKTSHQKEVHLSLMPNPSHLEAINSVLLGVTRSKQKLRGDLNRTQILPILIHGDAAFSGQGSIYEVLNMSELEGYTVGGSLHIILNNRIGFTTDPKDSRSTPNATDIAKMLEVPIFRINADEPQAALRCAGLALDYRNTFKRDVVMDLIGYRRYGHNEGDEPTYTQPLVYKKIKSHSRVRQIYGQRLIHNRVISEAQVDEKLDRLSQRLEKAHDISKQASYKAQMVSFGDRWKNLAPPTKDIIFKKVKTGLPIAQLKNLAEQILQKRPDSFHLHPKISRAFEDRLKMLKSYLLVDWALAETLAYGSLLQEGFPVRLAGQDVGRGTFSHRHAVLFDSQTGEKYVPLNHLEGIKADYESVNSLLSEYAALGFEFGQSLANPNKLTIWEAQFGDFVNGAQIIIDQFISSSASKWQRYSGLVLLLPHGYEGQGPEHSSARPERFLQACAKKNMQVCNLTSPAQFFHLMRRQLHRSFRLPLVILSPKSLLRHPQMISPLSDLEQGSFQEIFDDFDLTLKDRAKRLVLCSGKIYFDLVAAKEQENIKDVAIIRVEQYYPFPEKQLLKAIGSYSKARDLVWCQEEPKNMGAWTFMLLNLMDKLGKNQNLRYVGRSAQASPADGFSHLHKKEQKRIVKAALGIL